MDFDSRIGNFSSRRWWWNYFVFIVALFLSPYFSTSSFASFYDSPSNFSSSSCSVSFVSSTSSCRCFIRNDSKMIVDCSGQSLTGWPFLQHQRFENSSSSLRIESLNLSRNHLSVLRPSDLSDFGELKVLDVGHNARLNIETDAQWPLPYLETLNLQSCGLASVPSLNGLRNLTSLNLRGNTIGVLFPFRSAQRSLRVLDIGRNALVSFPVEVFPTNSSLRILNLNQNQINALQKNNFRNLSRLEALNLSHNLLRRFPKDVFTPLAKLKELDLSHNRFRKLEGLSFKGLKELRTLNLGRNRLMAMADGTFWDIPLLTHLILSDNRLGSVDRGWIYGLEGLAVLNLSRNLLNRLDAEAWHFCTKLQVLDLSINQLTMLRPRAFHYLRNLRQLNLRDNRLSLIYTNAFEQLAELTMLDLSINWLADVLISGQQIFLPLRNLRTLKLASNEIRVLPAGVFDGLRQLTTLDLSDNPLVVFSVNSLPVPGNLKFISLNTTSLLCDCQLSWLVNNGVSTDEDESENEIMAVDDVRERRTIHGTAECRNPPEWSGKSLMQLPANISCGTWPRPLIVQQPQSATGLRGQNVSFECQARCQEDFIDCHMSIHWRKNGRLLHPEPDSGLTISTPLNEAGENQWWSRLTIEAVEDEDSGGYQCQFANELASVMSEKGQLVVLVPPSLVKKPVDVAVRLGGTVRLECAATGNPAPTLSWRKDNGGDDFPAARERRMHLMPTDDVFFIVEVKMQDAGVYTCVAKSSAGEDTARARLSVYNFDEEGTAGGSSSTSTVPEISVRAGATAVLECADATQRNHASSDELDEEIDDGAGFMNELRWSRNGQALTSTGRSYRTGAGKVWIIKDASTADQGVYTCRTTRHDGVISERSWRLVVWGASDEVAKIGSVLPIPPRLLPPSSPSGGGADADKIGPGGGGGDNVGASTVPPPMASTTQSFFDPTGMPGVLVLVIVACVVLTSMAWVIVIIWRRRRPPPPGGGGGGVATVVVSLHENGTATTAVSTPMTFNNAQRPLAALPFDSKQQQHGLGTTTDTQSSVQLATVAF